MGQGIDMLGTVLRVVPERLAAQVDPRRIGRVLIVKLSSIGDVVHALPVATALKRAYPAMHVSWAVDSWTAPLIVGHPAIDRSIVFPSMTWGGIGEAGSRASRRAVHDLRDEPFDAILDLQGLARSAFISRLARGRVRLARQGQREGAHLVSRAVRLPAPPAHAVDEYLALARFLGAEPEPVRFDLPVQAAALGSVKNLLHRHGVALADPLLVVAPSTAKGWRRWPPERWAAVIEWLAREGSVVLSGRSDQRRYHEAIRERTRARVACLAGETTLDELVALLSLARLHVAPDTGSVHIAAALGTPVVALFGPTPAWRLAPYGQEHLVVDHHDRCGRGCPAYCVLGRRCIMATTAEEVCDRARAALASSERP